MNTSNDIWQKRKVKEKNLVTDQPGNFILFIGIFISLILGFSLRSLTQSKYLSDTVREATKNIGTDWQVSYEDVRIYLNQGWWPAIGLEISHLVIRSDSDCYLKPKAIFDKVRVPFSLIEMVFHQSPFSEVRIKKLNLNLDHSKPVCHGKNIKPVNKIQVQEQKNRISLIDKSIQDEPKKNQQLKVLRIDDIDIRFNDNSLPNLNLSNFIFENKSDKPKIFIIKTSVDLLNFFNTKTSDIKTELNAEYSEFPENTLKMNILGSLREGHFSLSLLDRLDEKKFQLQTEFKDVPIQKLVDISFLKAKPDSFIKSGWISFAGYSEGDNTNWESAKIELKRVKIEGGFGDIASEEINFPLGLRSQPEEFRIDINNLKLDSFIEANKLFKIPEQVNSFGTLNGTLNYRGFDNIIYSGNLEGLAFNFSGNSIRSTEKVDKLLFGGSLNKEGFAFNFNEIYMPNKLDGAVTVFIKKDKSFILKTDIKKIALSTKTTKLLTHKNESLQVDRFILKALGEKNVVNVESRIELHKVANEYLSLQNVEAIISSELNKNLNIKLKANKVDFEEKLKDYFLKEKMAVLDSYNQIFLNYNSDYEKSFWKVQSANKWTSVGGWDQRGTINGLVTSPNAEWIIHGTRDEPKLVQKSN